MSELETATDPAADVLPSSAPRAAVIEILERGRATDDTMSGGVIVPNDVRINGQSLLCPDDHPVIVHEINTLPLDLVKVTLTLLARRVTIGAELD